MTRKCKICARHFPVPAGYAAWSCPPCVAVCEGLRGLRKGECKTDHPDAEARLAEYGRRADAGLPLFGE